jgi:hypothetical protein
MMIYDVSMSEEPRNWYLHIRTVDSEYSFCCMSNEHVLQTLMEMDRCAGDVVEAELRTRDGQIGRLRLA